MTAAPTISEPRSNSFDFAQPLGREDGPEVAVVLRTGLMAISPTLAASVILQQLIYLTRTRESEWVEASARWLAQALPIPRSTVSDAQRQLVAAGLVASKPNPRAGGGRLYRVDVDAILEKLRKNGFQATRDAVLGYPSESRTGGVRDSDGGGVRDSDKKEQQQKESIKTSGKASARANREPEAHELHAAMQSVWSGATKNDAHYVLAALVAMGFSDGQALHYGLERVHEMGRRGRTPLLKFALKYMVDPGDARERGYKPRPDFHLVDEKDDSEPTQPPSDRQTNDPAPPESHPNEPEEPAPWSWNAFVERALELQNEHGLTLEEANAAAELEWEEAGYDVPDWRG